MNYIKDGNSCSNPLGDPDLFPKYFLNSSLNNAKHIVANVKTLFMTPNICKVISIDADVGL